VEVLMCDTLRRRRSCSKLSLVAVPHTSGGG
jgi:hypothetical protein